jgi:hypothetical protein
MLTIENIINRIKMHREQLGITLYGTISITV